MAKDFTIQVVDPDRPPTSFVNAVIPGDLYQHYFKTNEAKYRNLVAADFVLRNPTLIFEGVREYQEGGWCYVGRPASYFLRPKIEVPLPPGFVFAAYLNPVRRLYEWRLEPAESDNSPYPKAHEDRYKRLAWTSIS